MAALFLLGCSGRVQTHPAGAKDSTGTIFGQLQNTFVHAAPFYGSVVYLLTVTPSTEDWWIRFGRPRYGLVDPQTDTSLGFDDRTTCAADGGFRFNAKPGDYYLYARVLWANAMGDSTFFGGGAWIGEAKVAAGETSRVVLRSPRMTFPPGTVPRRRFSSPEHATDLELPRFGEYVHVEELPTVLRRVEPEYPVQARRDGIDGTVMLQVLVGKDGLVKDIRIVKSIPRLDEAATTAVRNWIFKPALMHNRPVAIWIAVPVRFKL